MGTRDGTQKKRRTEGSDYPAKAGGRFRFGEEKGRKVTSQRGNKRTQY